MTDILAPEPVASSLHRVDVTATDPRAVARTTVPDRVAPIRHAG